MKLIATSDLHGHLPRIPECDVLIIAGDTLPLHAERQHRAGVWLKRQLVPWLESLPTKHIIAIAGNHDFAFQIDPQLPRSLPWTYLQDETVTSHDLNFYGTPWIPKLAGWAFYAPDDQLEARYAAIPNNTDVVISHGPPVGHVANDLHPDWCSTAVNTMLDRVKPKAFICGHIHEGYGTATYQNTTALYNVAYVDLTYVPGNKPHVIHL